MNDDQNPVTQSTGWQFNPGDTVAPAQQPAATPTQPTQAPAPTPQPAVAPVSPANPAPSHVIQETVQEFANDIPADQSTDDMLQAPAGDQITWSASEYVAHHKTSIWYATLVAVSILGAGAAYLLTKDIISAVSILLIALVFGLSASRKPRVLDYSLDNRGLTIAQKSYPYGMFRSFAVIDEGAFSSIVFVPMKRFMPMLTIYYAPEDENQIVALIADHLPMEQRKRDAIDTLLHKIRF